MVYGGLGVGTSRDELNRGLGMGSSILALDISQQICHDGEIYMV